MTRVVDTLAQSLLALKDHRLRTALSILGITIGIAAVMAVSSISRGGNRMVYSELETFGLNSVWVFRDYDDDPTRRERAGSGIVTADFENIAVDRARLGIRRITPSVRPYMRDWLVHQAGRYVNAEIIGVGIDYPDIVNDQLIGGRRFMKHDIERAHPVALLAPGVASQLLDPTADAVGQRFRIGSKRYHVIGLLAGKSRDFLSSIGSAGGQDANDRILIPYSNMQRLNASRDIDNLHIEVQDFDRAAEVATRVAARLELRHRGAFRYQTETMASYIRTSDRILGGVAIIGIVAASISLLVGGMGIMNMMSTAVLERTREIGIRKAIGARERDILWQFLFEALAIAVVGGLIGLLFGSLASAVLAHLTDFPLLPSIPAAFVALGVSVLVGVLSGYLPARRAARLPPVEALRSEH